MNTVPEIGKISCPLDVGTRIHWDKEMECLYFVDVPNADVYKYTPKIDCMKKAKVGNEPLAFMFPVEGCNTKFIAGLGRKFVFVEWDGESSQVSKVETIAEIETEDDVKANRLNGAKVDPWGRLWAGTMGPNDAEGNTVPEKGSLYSLERGVIKKHEDKIGCSNGLAWNVSEMKMFYIDTLVPHVFQYSINCKGKIGQKKKIFDYQEGKICGKPDGLAIDRDGNLWVCSIFGGVVFQFCPKTGKVLQKIDMPSPQPTAITFGGDNMDVMYVTTAKIPIQGKVPPFPAGVTHVIKNVGASGCPGNRYIP